MCSCGTDMSVLTHSAETVLPYPWLPIPGPAPLPAPGDHPSFWVCPSKEAGRLLQDTNSKGCGAANTSLCCLLQALTNGIPTGWMDSAGPLSPTGGGRFQQGKPANTKTCRLEAKSGKLGWMGYADISATFNCCRNRAEKL